MEKKKKIEPLNFDAREPFFAKIRVPRVNKGGVAGRPHTY